MIEISNNLKSLLYSNYLPKPDIKIEVKRTKKSQDGDGFYEENVVTFTGQSVTTATLKHEVDITGAELPSMQLTWEQIYMGELDENMQPVDFYDVSEKMAVDFSVIYSFISYFSWDDFYDEGQTWSNIYNQGKTWQDVFYSDAKEEVKTKRLFLSAFPAVQGDKVKWEARDVLHFMNGQTSSYSHFLTPEFAGGQQHVSTRENVIDFGMNLEAQRLYSLSDRSVYVALSGRKSDFVFENVENADKYFTDEPQVFYGSFKEVAKNTLSPINFLIDFTRETSSEEFTYHNGGLWLRDAEKILSDKTSEEKRKFLLENQSSNPEITKGTNIANYNFEATEFFVDYDDPYFVDPSLIEYEPGHGYTVHLYMTDGASIRYAKDDSVYPDVGLDYSVSEDLDYVEYRIKGEYLEPISLRMYHIKPKATKSSIQVSLLSEGTDFEEKNPLNPFLGSGSRGYASNRASFLSQYYNANNSMLSIKTYGDPSIECCDFVAVETNLKNRETGENIVKKGIVTSFELTYNGAIKENFTIHELS